MLSHDDGAGWPSQRPGMSRFTQSVLGSRRGAGGTLRDARSESLNRPRDGGDSTDRLGAPPHIARQRANSEPFALGHTPGSREGSPHGSPTLRASSSLHLRHQSDLAKYGVRRRCMDDSAAMGEHLSGAQPNAWLRTLASSREPGSLRRGEGSGNKAMLVGVNRTAAHRQPEQVFQMPAPFPAAQRLYETRGAVRSAAASIITNMSSWPEPPAKPNPCTTPRASDESYEGQGGTGGRVADRHRRSSSEQGSEHPRALRNAGHSNLERVSATEVYNSLVDGLAGRLIVDTRPAEAFDLKHVWGAIDVEEALTYQGKHVLLMSQAGDVNSAAERQALDELKAHRGVLSIKVVTGGWVEWVRAYPFMCERTAASAEEEQEQRRARARRTYPSQVLPWLFISGIEAAQDQEVLCQIGVTHVISIVANPDKVRVPKRLRRLSLALRDEKDEDISACFDTAWAFACEARRSLADGGEGGKLLIHCKMGRSRSATLVLLVLLRSREYTLQTAWLHLRSCRRQMALNTGFVQQLIAEEEAITGQTSTVQWDSAKQQIRMQPWQP